MIFENGLRVDFNDEVNFEGRAIRTSSLRIGYSAGLSTRIDNPADLRESLRDE